jgi:hypothetical protein
MTDMSAADCTYSFKNKDFACVGKLGKSGIGTLTFVNTNTVASGGYQLVKKNMGCPKVVNDLVVLGVALDSHTFAFDRTNCKLLVYGYANSNASGTRAAYTGSFDTTNTVVTVKVTGY